MKVTKCDITGLPKYQEDSWIIHSDIEGKSWGSISLLADNIIVSEWHGYLAKDLNYKSEIVLDYILKRFNLREKGYHYINNNSYVDGTALEVRSSYSTFLEKEIVYMKSHIFVGLSPVLLFITKTAMGFNESFSITEYHLDLKSAVSSVLEKTKKTEASKVIERTFTEVDNNNIEIDKEEEEIDTLEQENTIFSKDKIYRSADGMWRFNNPISEYLIYGEIIDERTIFCKQYGDRTIDDLNTFFHINDEMLRVQDNNKAILIEYIGNSKNVSESKRRSIVSFYYSLIGKISHLIFIKPSLFQKASILMSKYLLKSKYKVHIVKTKGEALELAYSIKQDEITNEVLKQEVGHTINSVEVDKRIAQLLNIVGRISWDPTFDLEYSNDIIGNDEFSIIFESLEMLREDIISMKIDLESHSEKLKIEVDKATEKLINQNIELEKAKKQAEKSNLLKSAFLANMSHEIRTPMNAIVGLTDILKEDDILETDKRKYLDLISKSNGHLLNLINDVVDISKIESNEMKISSHTFCLNDLMLELLESQEIILKKSNKKSDIDYSLNLGLSDVLSNINADSTRLKQILLNLLNNAYKFTPKGIIEFGYTLKEDYLHFYVKDTGIGIEESKLGYIFERFTQAEGDTTRKFGGTGLGLSISKSLVELSGGEINVVSTFGEGSVFTFTIPYLESMDISTKDIIIQNEFDFKDLNILVAEDDNLNYTVLKALLKPLGCNLKRVKNGAEAISEITKNKNYGVILMDIQMPEMDGIEATKRITEITKDIPIIALSANAFEDEMYKIKEAGSVDYITKPITRDVLLESIKKSVFRK